MEGRLYKIDQAPALARHSHLRKEAMSHSRLSRRSLVTSAAALPALAVPALALSAESDPIFAQSWQTAEGKAFAHSERSSDRLTLTTPGRPALAQHLGFQNNRGTSVFGGKADANCQDGRGSF
jgi:hypothetical protein